MSNGPTLDDPILRKKPMQFSTGPAPVYEEPLPISDFEENKDFNKRLDSFTKEYTNSPEFARKRALFDRSATGYLGTHHTRQAVNRFDPNKHYDYGRKAHGNPAYVAQDRYGDILMPPKIHVDPAQVRQLYGRSGSDSFPKGIRPEPHEMGHVGIGGTEKGFSSGIHPEAQNEIQKRMRPASDKQSQRIRDVMSHKRSPEEARSDLHELRFYMDEAGVFDASKPQPFTQEHLDQYRKQKGQHHRLFNKFDDEGVIWMMNNIAQNQQPPGMFTGNNRYA